MTFISSVNIRFWLKAIKGLDVQLFATPALFYEGAGRLLDEPQSYRIAIITTNIIAIITTTNRIAIITTTNRTAIITSLTWPGR